MGSSIATMTTMPIGRYTRDIIGACVRRYYHSREGTSRVKSYGSIGQWTLCRCIRGIDRQCVRHRDDGLVWLHTRTHTQPSSAHVIIIVCEIDLSRATHTARSLFAKALQLCGWTSRNSKLMTAPFSRPQASKAAYRCAAGSCCLGTISGSCARRFAAGSISCA